MTALMTNTPTQAESQLHCQKRAAVGIGLHFNADKTEYMYFNQNQRGDVSTPNGGLLNLVDEYIGTSESST